jgi:exonuclease III
MQPDQLTLDLPGYHQYFNSAVRKGYSGTAVFTKIEPLQVTYDIGIEHHDQEGGSLPVSTKISSWSRSIRPILKMSWHGWTIGCSGRMISFNISRSLSRLSRWSYAGI